MFYFHYLITDIFDYTLIDLQQTQSALHDNLTKALSQDERNVLEEVVRQANVNATAISQANLDSLS